MYLFQMRNKYKNNVFHIQQKIVTIVNISILGKKRAIRFGRICKCLQINTYFFGDQTNDYEKI